MADTGTYTISLSVSDNQPLTVTTSFTLTITNVAPRLVTTILDRTASQNINNLVDLTTFFVDDDLDPITMSATFSFNGGAATSLPSGIFTVPSSF
jgi:hypothetical protein